VKESTTDVAQKPAAGNRTQALESLGQSVWLDYLRRSSFTSGESQRLIADDGLRGVTANPSIFEKAIVGSTDYLTALQQIERRNDLERGRRVLRVHLGADVQTGLTALRAAVIRALQDPRATASGELVREAGTP